MIRLSLILAAVISTFAAAAQAVMTLPESRHDFGAFSEELSTVTARIPAINTGTEPMVITNARATCGCTVPSYPKEPVAPGDTAWVSITYNAVGRPGKFSKKVYLYSNTTPARHAIEVTGVVIATPNTLQTRFPVEAGPLKLQTTIAAFGPVMRGATKSSLIQIYNASADSVGLTVDGLPPYATATVAPDPVPPGETAVISLVIDAGNESAQWGINSVGTVLRNADGDSLATIQTIAIVEEDFSGLTDGQRAEAPAIRIADEHLRLTPLTDQPQKCTVTVTNTGRSPLLVRRVYTPDRAITVKKAPSRIKPGKSGDIILVVDPRKMESDILNSRLSIITNAPDRSTAIVRIVGERQ